MARKYGYGQWFPVEQLRQAIQEHAMKESEQTPPMLDHEPTASVGARDVFIGTIKQQRWWPGEGAVTPEEYADAILASLRAAGKVIVEICANCQGTGADRTDGGPDGIPMLIDCALCKGVGVNRYAVRAALTERGKP